MATVVVMPQLGNSVESCLIVSWQVSVGDDVAENAIVCEVETDKASMEVPSSAAGTVLALLWDEGDDVPVKEPLLVVGAPGEDPKPALDAAGWAGKDGESTPAPAAEAAPAEEAPKQEAPADDVVRTAATGASSPRARSLAAANSLDISTIAEGSGPGGRVIERDVQAALTSATTGAARAGAHGSGAEGTGLGGRVTTADLSAAPAAEAAEAPAAPAFVSGVAREYPGPTTAAPLKGIRKVISERMMHSLASSAQLTYTSTAKAAGLLALRKKLKGSPEELGLSAVTIGDLVGFAAVKAAAKHTNHNAHLEDGTLTTFENVHLGMAVDTPRGLLVPTVRNASQMGSRVLGHVEAARLCRDRRQDRPRPARRRHLHRVQPRRLRHRELHPTAERAAGGDPGRRRDHPARSHQRRRLGRRRTAHRLLADRGPPRHRRRRRRALPAGSRQVRREHRRHQKAGRGRPTPKTIRPLRRARSSVRRFTRSGTSGEHFDVIVLGGGPGGYIAAERLGHAKKKVLLIEADSLGGTCLNVGCIPTKALLHAAKTYEHAKHGAQLGVNAGDITVDWTAMQAWKAKTVATLVGGVGAAEKKAGVTVVKGYGTFDGPGKVSVGGTQYTADHVILATGSVPVMPPIPGAKDNPQVVDSTGMLAIESIPARLAVIGGGVIGLEFASLFAMLGSEVTVVEMLPEIVPFMDDELAGQLRKGLSDVNFKPTCGLPPLTAAPSATPPRVAPTSRWRPTWCSWPSAGDPPSRAGGPRAPASPSPARASWSTTACGPIWPTCGPWVT